MCSQVEFESIKLELTQKNDEQEEMRAQMDEAVRLKEITERQLDEALEALKEEREQKNSLRRELSALTLNPFDSVGNLELHLEQLDDSQEEGQGREGGEGEGEDQDSGINNGSGSAPGSAHPPHLGGSKSNGLIRRYSTPRNSDVFLRAPASGLVSDLLSELHFSDSQKLKQQLLQVGNRTGWVRPVTGLNYTQNMMTHGFVASQFQLTLQDSQRSVNSVRLKLSCVAH